MQRWLVTGTAGFIGFHVARRLAADGYDVVGIDNLNDYYDPELKKARLAQLTHNANFSFRYIDLTDPGAVAYTFEEHRPHGVIHLAAQAGVRHSLNHPIQYVDSNVVGFMHILEGCRHHGVGHLVYASSSSIYGDTAKTPFNEHQPADHPVSIYAATKRANELMAHSYAHLFALPCTGLRFFTVYGPWGRPDMAYFAFAERIAAGEPITIYGDGTALRDFTYIDDIVEAVVRIACMPATPNTDWSHTDPDPATSSAPWQIFNIGHGEQVSIARLIQLLEDVLGRKAQQIHERAQSGDVPATHADTRDLAAHIDYSAATPIQDGIAEFGQWFLRWRSTR